MSMVVWKERRRMLWDDGQWPRRRIGRVIGVGDVCLAFAAFEYTATHGLGFFHKEPARQAEPTPKPVRVIRDGRGPPNRKDQEPVPHEQAALVAVSPPPPVRQPVGRAEPTPTPPLAVRVDPPPPRQQLAGDDELGTPRGHVTRNDGTDFCGRFGMRRVDYLKHGNWPSWRCVRWGGERLALVVERSVGNGMPRRPSSTK
jgi:hypothetical protein